MSINILVTAIGSFSASTVVESLGKDSRINKIYGCDIYPKEWHYVSKEFDEVVLSPRVSDEKNYLTFMLNLIDIYNINVIMPLTDIEVDFFKKHRGHFSNIIITIGSDVFLEIARNKSLLSDFVLKKGYKSIPSYDINNLDGAEYPLIVKPIDGRSSENIMFLNSIKDLIKSKDYSNYIFQNYINGDICTVDIVRNSASSEIVIVPRKELIRTKNGAGITVELFYDKNLIKISKQIAEDIDAHGAFNMEFILSDHEYYLMDINPRFSAGIGFTHLMGYDIVKNAINVFLNNPLEIVNDYKNLIVQKHMIEVINKKLS